MFGYDNVFCMFKVSDSSNSREVCLSGSLYRGRVKPGRTFRAGVWHVAKPDLDLNCYLWCTDDGEPPKGEGENKVDDELVTQLVGK